MHREYGRDFIILVRPNLLVNSLTHLSLIFQLLGIDTIAETPRNSFVAVPQDLKGLS